MKKIYQYKAEQFLSVTMDEAWSFFSSAKNLATITPPELDFKILTALDDSEIYTGMHIDYILRPLWGIPVRWQTVIDKVDKPFLFTDRQLKGPYALWEHTHRFIEKPNGVLMKDTVRYRLPFGVLGQAAHSLLVRKKIENIFTYRKAVLQKMFNHVHHID